MANHFFSFVKVLKIEKMAKIFIGKSFRVTFVSLSRICVFYYYPLNSIYMFEKRSKLGNVNDHAKELLEMLFNNKFTGSLSLICALNVNN